MTEEKLQIVMGIRLPMTLANRVDELAATTLSTRTQIVRQIVQHYFAQQDQKRVETREAK